MDAVGPALVNEPRDLRGEAAGGDEASRGSIDVREPVMDAPVRKARAQHRERAGRADVGVGSNEFSHAHESVFGQSRETVHLPVKLSPDPPKESA